VAGDLMTTKFVIQAHFRGQRLSSVHLDYRFQHPKYKSFFFGFTQFVDKGVLPGLPNMGLPNPNTNSNNDKERIQYAKNALANWSKYFKDPSKNRLGVRKSMGPTTWFKVDGIITKQLSDTTYSQVMLKIAEGTYEIFEDRIYSIKIAFDKVTTHYGVPDVWNNSTYIFRYLPFKDTSTPFSVLSWHLKNVGYSHSDLNYKGELTSKFDVYESSTEMNGHYLLKDKKSGKWYTVDRHPIYEDVFAILKGRYQIHDHLDLIEENVPLSIDLFRVPKEYYYIGVTELS